MDSIWQLDPLDWSPEELTDPSRDPSFSLFFDKTQPVARSTSVDPDSTDLIVLDPDPTEDIASVPSPTFSSDTTTPDVSRATLEHWLTQSLASPLPDLASLYETGHPPCSISPEVAPLVSVNVMYHVYEQYGCLPTRISSIDYDAPLPTYLIELPSVSSSSSTLRVAVSWPSVKRREATSQHRLTAGSLSMQAAFSYEQPVSINIRSYLRNNLQLRRMGLANSSPAHQQGTHAPARDLVLAPFDIWPSAKYSSTPSDKITSEDAELNRRAWPAIRCIKPQDQFTSSDTSVQTKEPSDNVPLFLSQRETDSGKGLERFEPTLLMKRFKKWTEEVQEEENLPDDLDIDLGALDLEEDLRLLEEESEFLFRNGMDIEDYKGLCARHGLQRMLNAAAGEAAVDDIMDQFLRMEHDDIPTTTTCDDQEVLCEDTGTGDMLLGGQGAVIDLPRVVGWTALNAEVLSSTTMESGRAMVDPDFVLEQDLAGSSGKVVRGTLKEIWPRLERVQQGRLLGQLARMLVVIWDNFDIMDDDPRDDPTIQQGLVSGKVDASTDDYEEIHRQTRPDGAGPWVIQDLVEQTATASITARHSAEEYLRLLEDEFMTRSFLDAVSEATRPVHSQSVGHGGHGQDGNGLLTRSSGDILTMNTASSGISSVEHARPPWDLGDIDKAQRMTTTRARAKESQFAQDKSFILPLRPDSTLECGSVRLFDFSLDDLLIQADICPEAAPSSSLLRQDPKIIGVSRWKSIGPRPPSTPFVPPPKDLLPRSTNVFQTTAQGSSYPLVHLFSLPDVFCPVQFGGQEEQEEQEEQEGLAHVLARSLAKRRPLAAEFLTEEVEDKERRMYHRWMAVWHERSPRAPKATRTRFEMVKILRKHCQNGRRLFGQVQGDDNNRYDRDYYYSRGGGREGYNSIPHVGSRRPLPPRQPQPENKEGADFTTVPPSSARCSRCRDEWNEQERTRQEKEQFHKACQVWDKLAVDGDHLHRKEEHRQSWEYGYGQKRTVDDAQQTRWDQVGKEEEEEAKVALGGLGLSNAQQHSLRQLLGLSLELGLGLGSVGFGVGMGKSILTSVAEKGVINHNDGVEGKSTPGTTATETTPRTRTHPWRLSEEEQAIVEAHLWGAMRQRGLDQQQ
ncbi:hypothetical protein K457DRAFT_21390 [Linnemannia elongata AG-77]|uniref:Uncharacterized protein n=1 Tax=Linnemannia elongata AG-77 TaxID=1314771 RepID=A0A197JPI7_9FUNG|nr:hypothetical protein K457DRAFT_21390 [Linnemannia elongata AG-77]